MILLSGASANPGPEISRDVERVPTIAQCHLEDRGQIFIKEPEDVLQRRQDRREFIEDWAQEIVDERAEVERDIVDRD